MIELWRLVSLRRLFERPVRSLLVVLGIALGVATVAATQAVNASILQSFRDLVEDVAGEVDLVITNGASGVPAALLEPVAATPGVAHAAGLVELITRSPGLPGPLFLLGLDFFGDQHFMPLGTAAGDDVLEDPFAFVNDPHAILITRALATRAKKDVGDTLLLLTPDGERPFTVRGVLADDGRATTFGGDLIVMFLEAAQQSFGRGERFDRIELAIDGDPRPALEALVGERGRVESPAQRARHLSSMVAPMERGLRLGGLVALIVGMFLIYNAVGVSVAQRKGELGTLRALGASRAQLTAMIAAEALALGAIGGGLGLVLAAGMAGGVLDQTAPNLSRFYAPIRPPPPEIALDIALVALLAGFVATLISALLPARAASKVDPITAMRQRASPLESREVPLRALLGLAAVLALAGGLAALGGTPNAAIVSIFSLSTAGLAVTPLLVLALRAGLSGVVERSLGIGARLALDNAERALGRTAITVAALMLACASSVCVSSWGTSLERSIFEWLDTSLPADLYVNAGSPVDDQHNVPFTATRLELARSVPGVRNAYGARTVDVDMESGRLRVLAVDTVGHFTESARKGYAARVVAGPSPIPPGSLREAPRIVLAENGAVKLGVTAGDTISLRTPTGRRDFAVFAVVVDYTSDQGFGFIDQRWYLEYFEDPLIDTIVVFTDGELTAVAAALREALGGPDSLFVISAAELRAEIRKVLVEFLAVFRSTDLIALIVALLGVLGAMSSLVVDRTREIGLLRAIGASRAQIRSTLIFECGFIGLAAAIGGWLAGIPMGVVFVRVLGSASTGWNVAYVFPWLDALRVALLVTLTATLAGLVVGRQAARIDVVEALDYE